MAAAPKPNALLWLLLSAVVIGLDQWSKAWVLASLPEYTAIPVIDGFWNWYRTYNTGAAFSFLADADTSSQMAPQALPFTRDLLSSRETRATPEESRRIRTGGTAGLSEDAAGGQLCGANGACEDAFGRARANRAARASARRSGGHRG